MRGTKLSAALLAAAMLAGCSVAPLSSDIETLLRAPQLSGQTAAVQNALNSYLGVSATLRYPASGEFLSPFLFGDWDGDGDGEAAVLYTSDESTNVWLAVLESTGDDSWQVTQTMEGLSGEVEAVTYAHLRDAESRQILVGYGSAQGDKYLVVYLYDGETLQTVISQQYTQMIVADMTGSSETEDLVLALPSDSEDGVNLQLLTNTPEGFRSAQTTKVGAGRYTGCAALHAGSDGDGNPWLIMDGWTSTAQNSIATSIIVYDAETGFLTSYDPPGAGDLSRQTLRYDTALVSTDIDGNDTIDIPMELNDGGELLSPLDSRLKFLLWRDYADSEGGSNCFGVYDSEYRYFLPLPESMHGNILIRSNGSGTGWLICNAEGTSIYCELRVVDPSEVSSENYSRIATIGNQQLQFRSVRSYYGLSVDDLQKGVVLFE